MGKAALAKMLDPLDRQVKKTRKEDVLTLRFETQHRRTPMASQEVTKGIFVQIKSANKMEWEGELEEDSEQAS